jgi:hypothetical protein
VTARNTTDITSLEAVLEQALSDAAALRRCGEPGRAELLEGLVRRIRLSAGDLLQWVDEDEACLISGYRPATLRRRFRDLASRGHARMGERGREYRRVAIPLREPNARDLVGPDLTPAA